MRPCPECRRKISRSAKICPGCGKDMVAYGESVRVKKEPLHCVVCDFIWYDRWATPIGPGIDYFKSLYSLKYEDGKETLTDCKNLSYKVHRFEGYLPASTGKEVKIWIHHNKVICVKCVPSYKKQMNTEAQKLGLTLKEYIQKRESNDFKGSCLIVVIICIIIILALVFFDVI